MFSCTSGDEAISENQGGCLCCRPQIQFLNRRIGADLSRRGFVAGIGASLASLGFTRQVVAQTAAAPPVVFTNFQLFDGRSRTLRGGLRLLIEADRIKALTSGDAGAPDGAKMID